MLAFLSTLVALPFLPFGLALRAERSAEPSWAADQLDAWLTVPRAPPPGEAD